jgi:hypothetical protein
MPQLAGVFGAFLLLAKTRIQNVVLAISDNSQDTLHIQQNV